MPCSFLVFTIVGKGKVIHYNRLIKSDTSYEKKITEVSKAFFIIGWNKIKEKQKNRWRINTKKPLTR